MIQNIFQDSGNDVDVVKQRLKKYIFQGTSSYIPIIKEFQNSSTSIIKKPRTASFISIPQTFKTAGYPQIGVG